MSRFHKLQLGFGKLEVGLLLAVAGLVFQMYPSLWWSLWSALDGRTWSRSVWFGLNVLILLSLFAVRFGPDVYADWKERRKRSPNSRRQAIAGGNESSTETDYEARVRRDAEWRERAKKRLPWHQ